MSGQIVHSREPRNSEPALAALGSRFLTEADDFYVRSHGLAPPIDPAGYRLVVTAGPRRLDLSLGELRSRFAERRVVACLQCAGNRRSELDAVRPVTGDKWRAGAIGNAEWTGVALADVLAAAGVAAQPGRYVGFTGLDRVDEHRFGVSIPLEKARSPEVLLAWAMNGAALRADHGAPLRVVVPGYAGVRSVKWLAEIELRDSPAPTPIQRQEYHLVPPWTSAEGADLAQCLVIEEMPLNAAICTPEAGARLAAGTVRVRGYAVAAGRGISRVDLSADGGLSWMPATLAASPAASLASSEAHWGWVLWEATLALPRGAHELVVRAWDRLGQTQPATAAEVWNAKGYLCTAWHRVGIVLD